MTISKSYPAVSHLLGAAFSTTARFCAVALLALMISGTAATAQQSVTITPSGSGAANVRTFDAGGSLTLNAASISGLDTPYEYKWTIPNVSPAGVTFSATDKSSLTINASISAPTETFAVRLEVFGSITTEGVTSIDRSNPALNSASVTVRNNNQSPTADAGDNGRDDKGATVTLDGTGSNDPDGNNSDLKYLWTQTAGPTVTLSNTTAAKPTFTIPDLIPADGPASLTFSLRVRDAAYPATDEDTDEVRIFVRPLFRATIADQTYSAGNAITDLTLPTALTTSGVTNTYTLSSVPPGLTFNPASRILSGTPTGAARTKTFNLTYTATNGDGDTDSLSFSITVTNTPATGAPTISGDLIEDQELTADPSGIMDENGLDISSDSGIATFSYQWKADGADITGATSATYTLTAAEIGKVITVTASFTDGGSAQESRTSAATAAVSAANSPPVASAGSNQTVDEGTLVTLDGSGTTDPDINPNTGTGDTLTYLWAQTSGTTVTLSDTSAISPTFTAPIRQTADDGELAFTLTVTDAAGEASTATVTISVTNLPPTANAGDDQTVDEGAEVTLDGSGSSGLAGDGRTYAWTQTGGTTVILTGANTITATFTAPTRQTADDGEFEFTLTVRDAAGAEDTDTVAISVSTNASVKKTVETINRFLETRTRLILANQPDVSRRINRLQRGTGSEQLSFATGEIGKLMPFEFNLRSLGSGNYNFVTSLDQVTRAANQIQVMQGGTATHESRRFDVWFEGSFNKFNGSAGSGGDFAIAHLGADYLMSPDLLVGGMLQYDRLTDSNDSDNSRTEGTGWMVGPYVTARLQENLYLDARVAGGKSDNDVTPVGTYTDSFSSTRWLADISLTGEFTQGRWTIRPNAGLSWLADKQNAYTNTLGVTIPSQTVSQGQLKFGPTISTQFLGSDGWRYEPTLTFDAIYSHANTSGGGGFLGADSGLEDGWRARIAPGISMTGPDGTRLSLSGTYDGIGQSGYEAWGIKAHFDMKF